MQQVGRHCHYQRAADEDNYQLCELIYEHFGTQTVVVRLHDPSDLERFHRLGALVVHPTTALVNLMDHFVRSPLATSLLLGLETGQDLLEVEVCDPTLHGRALRDLRLPLDTLVLSVQRDGHSLISHGYTQLHLGDRVTIVGTPQSLDDVALRFRAY
jgi:Trk K+ transport system NAD-binding subunit